MAALTEQKPKKKKTKKPANKANNASNNNNNNKATGAAKKKMKRKSAPAGSLAGSATKTNNKQKRGRSTTKKKVKKNAGGSRSSSSLQGSFSSLESTDSFSRMPASTRPKSMSDLRSKSQGPPARGLGKRPKSASRLDPSGHKQSPVRRLDMAGRSHQQSTSRLLQRHSGNQSLCYQAMKKSHSASSLVGGGGGGRGGSQRSERSLGGGGGRGGSQRSMRSLSREESPSSFNKRRLNRLMKRSGSIGGMSRQNSNSSLYSYGGSDDEGSRRSFSNRSRVLSNSGDADDLQKIIGMIESSNPDVLTRKKSPSRFQRFSERNRLSSSRSLDSCSSGHTMSSMASEDWPENETVWVQFFRYIRLLAPHPRECRSDRIIRFMIWGAMILDFVAAMVSIVTYESVTMCCGKPIFEILESQINWNEFVRISTYLYVLLIFLEVIPVFNKEIPLNLINPFIGFTITLAMFFDDRIGEAISMWAIEALAILFEAVITYLKKKQYQRHIDRIDECEKELEFRDGKRRRRASNEGALERRRRSSKEFARASKEGVEDDPYSDLESLSAGSLYNTADEEINRFRIERERRRLMAGLKNEEINLRYHFIGSAINIGLVLITLSFIIGIGKNGGLCISNFEAPPIFKDDQLQRCPACVGTDGTCEVCDTTGGNAHQCYYPYQL